MKIQISIKKKIQITSLFELRKSTDRAYLTKRIELNSFNRNFIFLSSADTVVDEDKDSSAPTHVVTVGVVGGVAAVAIVCVAVIIVLRKRRHTITLTESRGTHEFATPGV